MLSESLTDLLNGGVWLYCLATVAIALFAGMLATRYLCNRVSVDYYHSLPIRREGLLIQNWLCGILHFAMALACNIVLAILIILSAADQMQSIGQPLGKLFFAVGYMLVTYLLFYTLTVFCGMLCGTSFMQVVLTGLMLGAFPLFRVLALAFCNMVTGTIDIGSYLDGDWGWTSPFIRLCYLSGTDNVYMEDGEAGYTVNALENPLAWWEILLWILSAAILLLSALLLYRCRHVERAGTPVVFGGVAVAVKWIVMVLATMAMGWLFGQIGGGVVWIFFGFLLGGFLSFLLINTILTKNPKQMFHGWRAMLIYVVAFCIGSVGLGYTLETVEDIIPQKIDRVAIYFDNENYNVPYYTDPEVIAEWQNLWRADIKGKTADEEVYSPIYSVEAAIEEKMTDDEYESYRFNSRTIAIKAWIKVGPFIIPYTSRNFVREDAEALLRAVTESEEFEAGWDSMMESMGNHMIVNENLVLASSDSLAHVTMLDMFGLIYHYHEAELVGYYDPVIPSDRLHSGSLVAIHSDMLDTLIAQQDENICFDSFQSPVYALVEADRISQIYEPTMAPRHMRYQSWYRHGISMNTPALYQKVLGLDETAFYEKMADFVLQIHGGLYVAKRTSEYFFLGDANVMQVTDHAQIVEILRGLYQLHPSSGIYLSPFTVLDESYGIVFPKSTSHRVSYFIKGKVPAFVTSTLG